MIGIDTNVLVRFLVQDDPQQGARARAAFERLSSSDTGYLTTVVLVETYWVLRRAYRLSHDAVLTALEQVIAAEEMTVQDPVDVASALAAARRGADFADALIASACRNRGCHSILSFDEAAEKTLGFTAPR